MNMNKKIYPEIDSNPNFAQIEEEILAYWQQNNSFQKSIDERVKNNDDGSSNEFIFYDGPPFANGLPHYGHLLTGFVKDLFARYQTILGRRVERRFGWDCHGLPAEMATEKELGVSGRVSIIKHGIDKFNDHCRTSVMKYTKEWENYVTRQARWVDFENDYKTMDRDFMESVLWAFKQLFDKGLVYESKRVMPYSWACETPLSNFETRLDNSYRQKADKAVTVAFSLLEKPSVIKEECKEYKITAWTTTPWTLPSNLALAVGQNIKYTYVIKDEIAYIISKNLLKKYEKEFKDAIITDAEFSGKELAGLKYQPLFDYFKDQKNAFQILVGDFVTEDDGTGCVHMAPGFGEDDQIVCAQYGIELVCPVGNDGKFTSEVADYENMQVFEANEPIIIKLKENNQWIKTDQYLHNYPHCWRTDTPLIYKAVSSWYVEVTKFKDRMVELNQQVNWIPEHVKDGQFGKWLANARDWSISRNRFWGTPIPVWKSDDPKYPRIEVYGSIQELEEAFGVEVKDLHRPFIDELVRPNPDDPTGKSMMRRVEDVFDCWFESGSMPYGQKHYPFENREEFENSFPADFIVEYVAQTRGWFYTLFVLSTALFDKPPFLNCICHGVVLDENGQKLSKKLQNYADPVDIFNKYGADALRWLMISSPIMHGGDLYIDKDCNMVRDILRLVVKPIWNSYNFFTMYANADGIKAEFIYNSNDIMDQYILSKCHESLKQIKYYLDNYDTQGACKISERFFETLNNWYIRRSRNRFWQKEINDSKISAYTTLYTVLISMVKAISPLLPLITEKVYQGLKEGNAKESIHLEIYPDFTKFALDQNLVQAMDRAQEVCNSALSIRNARNLRVRLPLQSLTIVSKDNKNIEQFADIIKDEVNVKEIIFSNNLEEFAEYKLQLNFSVLAKRLSTKMKQLAPASKKGEWQITADKKINICDELLEKDEFEILLNPKNIDNSNPLPSQDTLVVLDINPTEELLMEGYVRDIVRAIQQLRKDSGLDITDKIDLFVYSEDKIISAVKNFKEFVCEQTLALEIYFTDSVSQCEFNVTQDLEGFAIKIGLNKK